MSLFENLFSCCLTLVTIFFSLMDDFDDNDGDYGDDERQ